MVSRGAMPDGSVWDGTLTESGQPVDFTTLYFLSQGRIVVPMPWTNVDYGQMTREPDLDEYVVERRGSV